MKNAAFIRILLVSLLFGALLSGLSLLVLGRLADSAASRHRGDFLLFLAGSVEDHVAKLSSSDLQTEKGRSALSESLQPPPEAVPPGHDGGDQPRHHRPPKHPPRFTYWVYSESGQMIFSSSSGPLELEWEKIERPAAVHDITSQQDFFRLKPGLFIIKLDTSPTLYLISREDHPRLTGPLFMTQATLTFATVLAALLFALSLNFFYLRRKSVEASAVLLRLERGDLKARFEIKRFDEFGGLLLDFNRMAQEIERLVERVHATESARKNLLQELGHDLRTPLTSLTTSFETLRAHLGQLSDVQREELFDMVSAEVDYLRELVEKLMTIAALDEPHYKKSTEMIDLCDLLSQEIKSRQTTPGTKLKWDFALHALQMTPAIRPIVIGDPHLILRLFKNAFDNASRFARARVEVAIQVTGKEVVVKVKDDGPGLHAAALESFAKRREQRMRREGSRLNFSLGLGSVIMKSIADLHEGRIEIKNLELDGTVSGAELSVALPCALAEQVKPPLLNGAHPAPRKSSS